ncbi:hypothetical protein EV128_14022 [Rhizobium azibense]|nr:hypothetical protein EV128_14022 [Rhizobium azibense]
MLIRPQYCARRDADGRWSIVDTQTHRVAVIAETLPLRRLDESTATAIIDALRASRSASGEPGASAEGTRGLSRFS